MLYVDLTNVSCYTRGNLITRRIELPIEPEILKILEEDLLKYGGEELFLTDWSKELNLSEYSSIHKLNEVLLYAKENNLLEEAICILNYDINISPEVVLKHLMEGNYIIFPTENDEELGHYLVENDLIAEAEQIREIPEHHINWESIGRDYSINNNLTLFNKKYVQLISS